MRREKRLGSQAGTLVGRYTWDHRDRLTKVEIFNQTTGAAVRTVTHAYDLNNRRISRFVHEGLDLFAFGGSIENRDYFYYDGDNVVLTLAQNMAVEHRYLHGPKVDQILADEARQARCAPADQQAYESTGAFIDTYWPITDHQGSVRDVLSAPGVRSEHIRYSGFGQIVEVRNGSTVDPTKTPTVSYAYTGREWDSDINLQYNRNRWYDPSTGRWISQDPIGFSAGDQNLYRYVGNGSVNKIDPMGKEPIYSDPGVIYELAHIGWWLYGGEVDYSFFKRMTKDVNLLQCNRGCIGLASFRAGIDQSLYFPWQAENSRMFLTQADAFTYAQDQQKHGNQCTVIAVQFKYGDPENDKLKPLRPGDSVPPGEIGVYQFNEYGDFNFSTYHAGCGKDGKGLWEYMTSGIMTDKNPLVKRVPALPTKYGPPKGFVVICWSKSDKPGPGFVPSFPGCNKR